MLAHLSTRGTTTTTAIISETITTITATTTTHLHYENRENLNDILGLVEQLLHFLVNVYSRAEAAAAAAASLLCR